MFRCASRRCTARDSKRCKYVDDIACLLQAAAIDLPPLALQTSAWTVAQSRARSFGVLAPISTRLVNVNEAAPGALAPNGSVSKVAAARKRARAPKVCSLYFLGSSASLIQFRRIWMPSTLVLSVCTRCAWPTMYDILSRAAAPSYMPGTSCIHQWQHNASMKRPLRSGWGCQGEGSGWTQARSWRGGTSGRVERQSHARARCEGKCTGRVGSKQR